MKKTAIYMLLILTGLLGSCKDNEEFKIPTSVGFQMDINRETSQNGRLIFTDGQINLASFSFDGRREEGGDVYFNKSYEEGLLINFDPNHTVEALNFQIPQGNYTRIEIELETYDETDAPGLVVTGEYLHSNGSRYPLRFELESSIDFEIQAREHSGSNQIVLVHSRPATPVISLNPLKWFEVIPPSYLENAVVSGEGGASILINERTNENIYELIISRIEQSAEVTFQ